MKRALMVLTILAACLMQGCAMESTVDSSHEVQHRFSQITDLQMRMLVEDINTFWLLERNTKLSYWQAHIGY